VTRSAKNIIGLTLSTIGVGAFALLLAFALMRLYEIERDMRVDATQNMLWVISQAQVAGLQLNDAITLFAIGMTDEPNLQRRFDVFLSRVALLDTGPQSRQMERLGFLSELEALSQSADALAPLLAELIDGDADAAEVAREYLEPHNSNLGRAANAAMVAEWDDLGEQLDTHRDQLWHIIASLAGISLIGGLLSLRLLLALRETKRRSHLLQSEKAFSELVIGSSDEGILAIDLGQICTVWNAALNPLFDIPPHRAVGMELGDISGFFKLGSVQEALAKAYGGQSSALFDQVFFQPGADEPLFLYLRCFPLRRETTIMGAIVFISDVTERRAAQMELARHREGLEELVIARTRELNEALARERTAADLYRNFAAMVSHQFRTPLAIIDSALQRMMRRRSSITPDEIEDRAGKARHAIMRLTELVESTLDSARLDAGQIEVRSRPCDLAELVHSVCERQREASPDREITVLSDTQRPLLALCDPAHAEHIVLNLVSNAIKYSNPRTPVHVTLAGEEARVTCMVSNTGRTIDATETSRLFERNFRGSNANGIPGTGIGLYMARTLARMQNGDVELVRLSPDQTTFCLVLPLASEADADPATGLLMPAAEITT